MAQCLHAGRGALGAIGLQVEQRVGARQPGQTRHRRAGGGVEQGHLEGIRRPT